MPPAFVLSHDQTLKFMYDTIDGEFHDQIADFKEPLCILHMVASYDMDIVKGHYENSLAYRHPTP